MRYVRQDKRLYPNLICVNCATENEGFNTGNSLMNYYSGECGWCKKWTSVTMPKYWSYPKPPKERDD